MAQFYLGIWAGKGIVVTWYVPTYNNGKPFLFQSLLCLIKENEKPYKDKKDQMHSASRFVSKQPLMFDNGAYNLRKLNQLPHHLLESREINVLKDEVICNFDFLLARISALGIG